MTEESIPKTSQAKDPQPILLIVMGVASTGKTTLAKALNQKLGMPYVEGDDLHPKTNIEKMSNNIPLTDEDREPWLDLIRSTAEHMIAEQIIEGTRGKRKGVMVTCSALKKHYRQILRGAHRTHRLPEEIAPAEEQRVQTYFVYIKAEEKLLRERMAQRKGHFMKPAMLDSQLMTLESPEGEKGVVSVPLDASTEEQVQFALDGLKGLGLEDLYVGTDTQRLIVEEEVKFAAAGDL